MKRPPILAGTWYEGEFEALHRSINDNFAEAEDKGIDGHILGLISPHAGHFYSGRTAAAGYRQLKNTIDLVVIISPAHQLLHGKYVINACTHYQTPLGDVPVDRDTVNALQSKVNLDFVETDREHSIEIQLPFLQYCLDSFLLLPIMVGHDNIDDCGDLVSGLMEVCNGKNVLFVASSDLHHIDDYNTVVKKDQEVIEALEGFELTDIRNTLKSPGCSVCGRVPIIIVLDICQRLGADKLEIIEYTTSGDIVNERKKGKYTVGYLSAAAVKSG